MEYLYYLFVLIIVGGLTILLFDATLKILFYVFFTLLVFILTIMGFIVAALGVFAAAILEFFVVIGTRFFGDKE